MNRHFFFHNRLSLLLTILGLFLFAAPIYGAAETATALPDYFLQRTPQPDGYVIRVMDAVNQFRENRWREKVVIDTALAKAAQIQADYLLKIGRLSEIGEQRKSMKTLASEEGYGGGAKFRLSQMIAMTWGDTPADYLVNTIWGANPRDVGALLEKKAVHIGIGEASEKNRKFVVLLLGYLESGSLVYTPLPTRDPRTPTSQIPPTPTIKSFVVATPAEDGSITHIVEAEQTLSEIAYGYHALWEALALQNNLKLDDPVIYEGQKLLIRPKFTPTVTPTVTNTPRPPTRTPRPTYTAVRDAAKSLHVMVSPTPVTATERVIRRVSPHRHAIAWALIFISGVGLAFTLGLKRK